MAMPWLVLQAAGCSFFADLDFPEDGGVGPPGSLPEGGDPWSESPDGTVRDTATPADAMPLQDARQASDASPPSNDGKVPGPLYADVVLTDRPAAYWRVGERSGTEAKDQIGGHPGVYEKGFSLGIAGAVSNDTAVQLDGQTGSRIRIGDFFDFGNNAPCTLEAWAKWKGGVAGYVIAKRFVTDGTGYALFASSIGSGTVLWAYARTRGDRTDSVTYTAPASAGFVHIVATYDGSKGRLYFNGSEVASANFAQFLPGTSAQLVLGANSGGDNPFKGALDELAIYDRVLPADRIRAHFLAASAK